MANSTKFLWLLVLLAVLPATQQQITIRNIGCKTTNPAGVCTECSVRYYLDAGSICQPVNPNCNTYNTTNGACLSCYPGFGIVETTCLPGVTTSSYDPNCNQFNGSLCVKCSSGYYLPASGLCTQVNPSCKTFDPTNGQCLSCFPGFSVQNGGCLVGSSTPTAANCNQLDSNTGKCIKCSFGFYFDVNGNCIAQDPNCKNFNTASLTCTDCYPGFSLVGGSCSKSANTASDPNCKTFNGSVCVQCAKGAIFNPSRVCIVVDPSCFTYDSSSGACTGCYPGFALSGPKCMLAATTTAIDTNCLNYTGGRCVQCSLRYIVGANGICQNVNPLCNTYNPAGACLSCYPGYGVSNGNCVTSAAAAIDQYCKTLSPSTGLCLECAFGAYFAANKSCVPADPVCKTFNASNGNCLTCYDSFVISGPTCVKGTATLSDPNCAQFYQGVCLKCSTGFIFMDNGLCGLVNSNCKTFNNITGQCTSCYQGYQVSNGLCVNGPAVALDPNCAAFNGNLCTNCSRNFYFGPNALCLAVDPLCNGYNPVNGACTGCYQSFALQNGACVPNANNSLTDPNCASFLGTVCVACGVRTFMNNSGFCQPISVNCNTYNNLNGQCTSCYPGFNLQTGVCSASTSPSSCSKFNNDGTCAQCGGGSYLNNGACVPVDLNCAYFDLASKTCFTCYSGYSVLGGVCQISSVSSTYQVNNCYAYDQFNKCINCFTGFYLTANTCQAVSVFCKSYDGNTGLCTSCYSSFKLNNGVCSQ